MGGLIVAGETRKMISDYCVLMNEAEASGMEQELCRD